MNQVKTRFSTPLNGFRFVNRYELKPSITRFLPIIGNITPGNIIYGLCGGMCFAAMDYFYANHRLPEERDVKKINPKLFNYLVKRQADSMPLSVIFKVLEWMLTDDDLLGSRVLQHELPKVRSLLDNDQPVVLCLIRTEGVKDPTQNHQVLATGYAVDTASGEITLTVYDPNHPGTDPTISICKSDAGVRLSQSSGERLRGFFHIPYKPVKTLPKELLQD